MVFTKTSKVEDKVEKPGYDARLQYYDVLKDHLTVLATASYSNDYANWIRSLRALRSMTYSFMDSKSGDAIKVKLVQAEKYYNMYISRDSILSERLLVSTLEDATDLLHKSAKHMFLPGGIGVDTNDLSMEEFFKGSDL
jgi:hypothetical protein